MSAPRPFPPFRRRKQWIVALCAVALAGCGGGDDEPQPVLGAGFRFEAPAGWDIVRSGRTVAASDGERAVSVTTFRLAREYRPALWPRVVPELDRVADRLARELEGRVVARTTSVVAGRRARVYGYSGAEDDTRRIAFLLVGRREYQLLCRGEAERECNLLFATFRLR